MKLQSMMVERDPGDDSVILRVWLTWMPSVEDAVKDRSELERAVGHVMRGPNGLTLAWAVLRGTGRRQRFFNDVCDTEVDPRSEGRWPLSRIGPGVWDLPTSIFVKGQVHAFVTLIDVPEPAPWRTAAPATETP